ncbi:MAG: PilN domain-containing protein [Actinomycetota bacterium]
MEAVNLLPGYARPAHGWATLGKDLPARRVVAVGGAVAAAGVIVLGGLFVYERSVVNDKQDALVSVQTQLAEAQAKAAPLRAVESARETKLGAIRTISDGRVPWENVLRDLARVLPSKVQLQTVQVAVSTPIATVGGAAPASAGTTGATSGFTVTGSASSHNRVALVLDRLAVLPWLSNVTLQSTTRGTAGTSGGSGGADTFTISANFDQAGVPK